MNLLKITHLPLGSDKLTQYLHYHKYHIPDLIDTMDHQHLLYTFLRRLYLDPLKENKRITVTVSVSVMCHCYVSVSLYQWRCQCLSVIVRITPSHDY